MLGWKRAEQQQINGQKETYQKPREQRPYLMLLPDEGRNGSEMASEDTRANVV